MATKKAAKQKTKLVSEDSLAEALHVALRKACDSTPTSLLWNLIYKLDHGVWEAYLDHVWLKLQIAVRTNEDIWSALKIASKEFRDEMHHKRDDKIDFHSVHLLDITFEMMTDDDWHGYAAYLTEED